MYCKNCGTQLPDDANFCLKCGRPQKDGIQVEEPKWETCEIRYEVLNKGNIFSRPDIRFLAVAYGAKGKYMAGASKLFTGDRIGTTDTVPFKRQKDITKVRELLHKLETSLLEDGWEFVGSFGESYWEKRFRRRI